MNAVSKQWADKGYGTREYGDHVVAVRYKDKELAAFPQTTATQEDLDGVCERHEQKLQMAGTPQ